MIFSEASKTYLYLRKMFKLWRADATINHFLQGTAKGMFVQKLLYNSECICKSTLCLTHIFSGKGGSQKIILRWPPPFLAPC